MWFSNPSTGESPESLLSLSRLFTCTRWPLRRYKGGVGQKKKEGGEAERERGEKGRDGGGKCVVGGGVAAGAAAMFCSPGVFFSLPLFAPPPPSSR